MTIPAMKQAKIYRLPFMISDFIDEPGEENASSYSEKGQNQGLETQGVQIGQDGFIASDTDAQYEEQEKNTGTDPEGKMLFYEIQCPVEKRIVFPELLEIFQQESDGNPQEKNADNFKHGGVFLCKV